MEYLGSSIIIFLSLIIFPFLMYKYWKLLNRKVDNYRYALFILRLLSIFFLFFLVVNPLIKWQEKENILQNIDIIFDLSESMFVHAQKQNIDFQDIQSRIEYWGHANNLKIDFFKLGKNIAVLDGFNNIEQITNFNNISDFILFEQSDQILLITDGKATEGREINNIKYDIDIPIHTIGVGPIYLEQDIWINDIVIPKHFSEDTALVIVKIESQLRKEYSTIISIQNELEENIYNNIITFKEGNQFAELYIKILASKLHGINIANIIPIKHEKEIHNNRFSFRGDLLGTKSDIILVSGNLSNNSFIISQSLNELEDISLHHAYRKSYNNWNQDVIIRGDLNIKMIVLDDFPIYSKDEKKFKEIMEFSLNNNIPIIYIEGPSFDLVAGEIIHMAYPGFTAVVTKRNMLMNIVDQVLWLEDTQIELERIPPQNRNFKWMSDRIPLLSYQDGSVMIGNINMFYLISIPNLAKNHFQLLFNHGSTITELLKKIFLYGFYGENGMLTIATDSNVYNKGESINVSLHIPDGIDLKDFMVFSITKDDTSHLQCKKEIWNKKSIDCSSVLTKSGDYTFYGKAIRSDGKEIYTKTKSTFVRDIKVELKELIQERQALMEISYETGGIYTPIDSLDFILGNIDISPIQGLVKHQISGIKVQNYWWILIVLLSFEWYLRKKVGVL